MKSLIAKFSIVVLMLCAIPCMAEQSNSDKALTAAEKWIYTDDFIYKKNDFFVTIIQYNQRAKGSVSIPSVFEGLPVTVINSFECCEDLTSITLPDSIIHIGKMAFSGCDNLTNITIPDSVVSIGPAAFHGCQSLTSVTIPRGVSSMLPETFSQVPNLTDIYFLGNAPEFNAEGIFYGSTNVVIHYRPGTTGWKDTFEGRPTVLWNPQFK
ncbi:leucine-rich repeat domain-containing protein [Pontiellaceae bacterium B1224]|nr:leucine-rich repeat domain-containing protein [Pontiellaceae bacterium B1224]